MEDRVFVVLAPGELGAPGERMRAFVPAAVVQNFLAGPVETHFRIAADVCSTIGHRHGDIVRRGVDVQPEIADALIEIATDWLTWCIPPICVCAIRRGPTTKLCDKVALRVS